MDPPALLRRKPKQLLAANLPSRFDAAVRRQKSNSPSIRLIKHEVVPDCGSFELRATGAASRYFYWDDLPSRQLRPEVLTREQALDAARKVARVVPDEIAK